MFRYLHWNFDSKLSLGTPPPKKKQADQVSGPGEHYQAIQLEYFKDIPFLQETKKKEKFFWSRLLRIDFFALLGMCAQNGHECQLRSAKKFACADGLDFYAVVHISSSLCGQDLYMCDISMINSAKCT